MYKYLIRFVLDNQVLGMIVACFISLAPGENSVQWWSSITPKLIVESGVNYRSQSLRGWRDYWDSPITYVCVQITKKCTDFSTAPLWTVVLCGTWKKRWVGISMRIAIKWNFVIRKLMSKTKSKHWRDWKYQCPIFLNFQT